MAEKAKSEDKANQAETQAAAEPVLSPAEAAKRIGGKVRVPALDKKRAPIVEGGVYQTETRSLRADDILRCALRDDRAVAITVDGQKLTEAA